MSNKLFITLASVITSCFCAGSIVNFGSQYVFVVLGTSIAFFGFIWWVTEEARRD